MRGRCGIMGFRVHDMDHMIWAIPLKVRIAYKVWGLQLTLRLSSLVNVHVHVYLNRDLGLDTALTTLQVQGT